MKQVACMLSLALALPVWGIAQQRTDLPFTTNGAFFALSVADLSASSRWYQDKLGLRVVMQPPKAGDATAVILEGGGLLVELVQHDKARSLAAIAPDVSAGVMVHGYFKVGLLVDDFDKTLATLHARGVTIAYGPYPQSATMRANAIIRDNAGNLIQFFGK